MDKITTQDCYLPVDVRVRPEPHDFVPLIQGHWLEKHNMVCLTKEQLEEIMYHFAVRVRVEVQRGISENGKIAVFTTEYINSIIK